jgi:hypothetical protein
MKLPQLGYHPFVFVLRKLLFQTPLGDLAGGQTVRDQKRFTPFYDNALAGCRMAQQNMDTAGTGSKRGNVFYHLFRGTDPESGQGDTQAELETGRRLLVICRL